MKPLFLVGYMGCGKSTLGRKLARRLGVDFIDTDALVEEREGASVADVFRYEGEERFREAERRVLDEVIAGASFAVVSTGGGLPTWRDNLYLRHVGFFKSVEAAFYTELCAERFLGLGNRLGSKPIFNLPLVGHIGYYRFCLD